MDAEQIIETLSSRYKRLKTYQDAGIVQFNSFSHASTMSFKTYFQAPSLYKFQWRNEFTWNEDAETTKDPGTAKETERQPAGATAANAAATAGIQPRTSSKELQPQEKGSMLEISVEEHGQVLEPTRFGMVWANSEGVFCKKYSDEPKRKRNLRSALTESPIMEQVAQRPMGLIFPNLVPRDSRIDLLQNGVLKLRSSNHNYHRLEFEIPDGTLNVFIHAENFSLMRTITTVRAAVPEGDAPVRPDEAPMPNETADETQVICIDCFYTKVHFDAYINEVMFTDSP